MSIESKILGSKAATRSLNEEFSEPFDQVDDAISLHRGEFLDVLSS